MNEIKRIQVGEVLYIKDPLRNILQLLNTFKKKQKGTKLTHKPSIPMKFPSLGDFLNINIKHY